MVPLPRLIPAQYTARVALSPEAREAVYRLRYRAYLAHGYISPNADELFKDEYDDLPNSVSILLELDGRPVASVRTSIMSVGHGQRCAAGDIFSDAVDSLLTAVPAGEQRGIEFNRLVRSPECENNQGLVLLLYRMAGYVAMTSHSQLIFACVRPHHLPFYKRLGLRPAAPARPYPGLNCPMELLFCTRAAFDHMRFTYPVVDAYTAATGPLNGFLAGEPVSLTIVGP